MCQDSDLTSDIMDTSMVITAALVLLMLTGGCLRCLMVILSTISKVKCVKSTHASMLLFSVTPAVSGLQCLECLSDCQDPANHQVEKCDADVDYCLRSEDTHTLRDVM